MKVTKKYTGMSPHRWKDNPEEKAFAKAWAKSAEDYHTLSYLLAGPEHDQRYHPPDPSPRDYLVAATMVQWLGSPVGRSFLEELGYKKEK